MKFTPKELKETADISRGRFDFKRWVKRAAAGLLAVTLLYIGIGVVTDLIVVNISEETEARWFGRAIPETNEESSEEFQRAQRIFEQLITSVHLRPLPYRLYLWEFSEPNAVAVPGGGVGVTSALLQKVKSEVGLATVLAHELGHHEYRHGLKSGGRALLWQILLSLAMAESDFSGSDVALRVTETSYSRDQEREADRFALQLVHEVYGDTKGALEFFELVQRESDEGDSPWVGLLSSHPLTAERIAYLKKLQRQLRHTSWEVGSGRDTPPMTE